MSPAEFIPIAENTPLSGQLTYLVFETAASELGAWLRANRNAYLSLNVPPEILGRGGLAYVLEKCGIADLSGQLIGEITERGLPDLLAVAGIAAFTEKGGRFALDDVTLVGGANLAILARCDLAIIKLDMTLISQIRPESTTPDWLEGIEAMLHSSRLMVIAEGVESEFQARVLRAAGIQAAQGYYFARPMSASAFTAFYEQFREAGPFQQVIQRQEARSSK